MNNIRQLFDKSVDTGQFVKNYFNYLTELLNKLEIEPIVKFIKELEAARQNQNTVYIIGNGGSAATASHMANDLGVDVLKKGKHPLAFKILSLTDNIPVMTAISNDEGFENLFVNQLKIHYKTGDKLVAISASGNSENVINAAKWVKAQGGRIISLVGFDGGMLKKISDLSIHVKAPHGEFGPVEDIHMILDHLISTYFILSDQRKTYE